MSAAPLHAEPLHQPLRLLLVDDEPPALLRLQTLLGDIADACPTVVVAQAQHAQAALTCIQTHTVDAVLLDIQMPGMTGLELARHLHTVSQQSGQPTPAIIFTTAYDQHALEAFELQALDYLMKPVRAQRLQDALQRVAARIQAQQVHPLPIAATQTQRQHITIHQRGKLLLVPVADILYFKAELKYVTVRTAQAEYLLEESLIALEEEFNQQFIRVHRNAIVARHAVRGFERSKVVMKQEDSEEPSEAKQQEGQWEVIVSGIPERLPISRRQWSAVKALLPSK